MLSTRRRRRRPSWARQQDGSLCGHLQEAGAAGLHRPRRGAPAPQGAAGGRLPDLRRLRLQRGGRGAHHRARPGVHRHLLGQSVRHALRPDPGVGPDPRRRRGRVVEGDRPVNVAAFAIHGGDPRGPPRAGGGGTSHSSDGKAWSALGRVLDPITQDPCAFYRDHVFYDDTRVLGHRVHRGRRDGAAAGRTRGDPAQPRPPDRRPDRRRGDLVVHLHGALLPDPVPRRVRRNPAAVDAANARAARGGQRLELCGLVPVPAALGPVPGKQPDLLD